MSRIGGITASISSGGFDNQKQSQLQIQGPDSNVLVSLAERLAADPSDVADYGGGDTDWGSFDYTLTAAGQTDTANVSIEIDAVGA